MYWISLVAFSQPSIAFKLKHYYRVNNIRGWKYKIMKR